jgi:PAS domain S-box-containing protein
MTGSFIKALLIEDNPADARLIEEMLKESVTIDFTLESFNRLSKGIEYLNDHIVDIVLLDLSLPDSTGIETFEKLYKHAPHVPIIVLTGVNDEQLAIESLRSGLQDYLVKNKIDGDLLIRSIRYAIERKHLTDALQTAHDQLDLRVKKRTLELSKANRALHEEVAERKRIEAALRESEERLDYSLNAADLGAWDLDIVGQATWRSLEHDQIFGYKKPLPKWNLETLLSHVLPEDRAEVERKFQKAVSDHEGWNFECRICRADGEIRWIWKQGRCKYDADGKAIRMAGVIQDITERKNIEEELKESKAQAELYVDLMGHDINNMNHIAMGFIELALDRDDLSDETRGLIKKPIDTINNGTKLIDNVRKLQRIKSRKLPTSIMEIGSVLSAITADYSHIPGKDVKISYTPACSCMVIANEFLVDVFTNLIGNSIKHSNGSVQINIYQKSVQMGGKSYCEVIIEDNGPGIPDKLKDAIFNRNSRGNTKAMGTGIGLYLVKTLVDDYGGSVRVEDRVAGEQSKGSRFIVILPAVTGSS